MNYLAHAYLSFGHPEILLGNMISDFVKGKQQFLYPTVIHKGILLHRAIDEFTDMHVATKTAKQIFKPAYRLYAGAFVDVAYDHFLARDTTEFTEPSLYDFSQTVYSELLKQENQMPHVFKRMFYYMRLQNWLYEYRTHQGIFKSFGGLVQRAAYLTNSQPAITAFEKNYDVLKDCYTGFWKDVKKFASSKYYELIMGQ